MTPPPPSPRRADHTILWVLLGAVIFGMVLLFSGVYIFSRYIARQVGVDIRQAAGGRTVDIETPLGSLQVQRGEVSESQLGLPIYPGARRKKREGATISLDVPSESSVRVVAAEFETSDPIEKVLEFYRERLGGAAVERRLKGRIALEITNGGAKRIVVLRRRAGGAEIALANVNEGAVN